MGKGVAESLGLPSHWMGRDEAVLARPVSERRGVVVAGHWLALNVGESDGGRVEVLAE
jgi:hypothetical protein